MTAALRARDRRGILKRGLLAIGAVAGFIAGRGEARAAIGAPGGSIRLYGRNWQHHSAHLHYGEVPKHGDRLNVYAELADAPEGQKVGELYSAAFLVQPPFRSSAMASGALEMHTLVLAQGTIVAVGAGSGAEREFAVVGGTGRYAGVRGSYAVRLDRQGRGDGAVELAITLL